MCSGMNQKRIDAIREADREKEQTDMLNEKIRKELNKK
jgi:hypothetical protein